MNSNNSMLNILIVEDHNALALNLAEYFDESQYSLDFASDGLTALHLLATCEYDVIVLDIMLPAISGLELASRIRRELAKDTPIIIMTAKGQLEDKQIAFESGVDDYLVKPFELKELELRILALARRYGGRFDKRTVVVADISYDPSTLMLSVAEHQPLQLHGMSARIFEQLIRYYPKYIPYQQLQQQVWGEREVDMNTIRTQTYVLRKLLSDHFGRSLIKTINGAGYQLDPSL